MSADRTPPDQTTLDPPPSLLITGGTLLQGDRVRPADLHIVGGRINRIDDADDDAREGDDRDGQQTTPPRADRVDRVDATGLLVAPGLIDLQINGGHGHDLWSDPASMWELADLLPRSGVTSFCPTIISGPPEVAERALSALANGGSTVGAEPLGLHLEGPMLAPDRRGAHDPDHLATADSSLIEGWSREAGVRLVTLAPELPGATEIITGLVAAGVVVAAGHSDATAEQAAEATEAGVTMVTHLFNAMAPLHHRQPGLIGHTLGGDDLTAGLIVDGVHLAPEIVALALRALGPTRLVLVSDAVAAMGLEPGVHQLGGRTVHAGLDAVRRPDGTLAGSNLTLDQAVRNLQAQTGCEIGVALGCASANPARLLGEDDRGHLDPGAVADLVLLDHELQVVATVCRGRVAHLADDDGWRVRPSSV